MRLARDRLVILGMSLLLGACATQYSVSEREMEQYLNKELHYEVKQGNGLLGAKIQLTQISVRLGEKPDTMAVTAQSQISLHTPLMPLTASLNATFEARPWYDSEHHSVYLRGLQLVKLESNPADLEKAIKQISPQLMAFVGHFLETQPVYVLDTKDSNQALMAKMTKRIEVKPGKLSLIFKP